MRIWKELPFSMVLVDLSLVIDHGKVCDLRKLAAIFQHVRIDLELFAPAFLRLLFLHLLLRRILSDQKLLVHIYHLLR